MSDPRLQDLLRETMLHLGTLRLAAEIRGALSSEEKRLLLDAHLALSQVGKKETPTGLFRDG